MARHAKIYFQELFAGILTKGDAGYTFVYTKEYLEMSNSKVISLTLPLTERP